MLKEIDNTGLYAMTMPVFEEFGPHDILPIDLDVRLLFDEEASNELVRRLLEFCVERKEWVGVGWTALMNRLSQEMSCYQDLVARFRPTEQAYQQTLKQHVQRNKRTLGLYKFIQPAPLQPKSLELAALEKKVLWSLGDRRQQLGWAAMKLKQEEYLKVEVDKESDERTNVFFIVPSLVLKYVDSKKV